MRNSRVPVYEASCSWQSADVIDIDATSAARPFLESHRGLLAVPTRCRTDANGQVTRAKCILRMAQCIAVMGTKPGTRYRPQVPIRPHTAPYRVPALRALNKR